MPDNLEVKAFLESDSITEEDVRAGKYDNCEVELRLVNWADLNMGDVQLSRGTLGVIKMKNGEFTAEFRGLAHKLTAQIGATYGPICRATFGSGLNDIDMNSKYLCKFDVSTVRQNGSVETVNDLRTFNPVGGLNTTADWFNDGFLTFTSGQLAGQSFEVKAWDGTTLELHVGMPALPVPGDTFTIEPGCNKTTNDCQGKFTNIANFRGEPFIPGMDQLLDYPTA